MVKSIKARLRSISWTAELALILTLAFGLSIVFSTLAALSGEATRFDEADLWWLIGTEVPILFLVAWILHVRGWRSTTIGLDPTWQDIGQGLVLYVGTSIVVALTAVAFQNFLPSELDKSERGISAGAIGLAPIVLASLINGTYEETLLCGYLISKIRNRASEWTAINCSVALRLSYHLYQGSMAITSIIPMGLLFGIWFARTGKLLPLIVAHAMADAASLSIYQKWF